MWEPQGSSLGEDEDTICPENDNICLLTGDSTWSVMVSNERTHQFYANPQRLELFVSILEFYIKGSPPS